MFNKQSPIKITVGSTLKRLKLYHLQAILIGDSFIGF